MKKLLLILISISLLHAVDYQTAIPIVFATSTSFIADEGEVVDTTLRLQEYAKSVDSTDPDYILVYTNSKGKRKASTQDFYGLKVGGEWFVQDKSDLFGKSIFRKVVRCGDMGYYSFLSTDTYNHTGAKDSVSRTWYLVYFEGKGMVKPLTTIRVKELLIRKYPTLYNQLAAIKNPDMETLISYLEKYCEESLGR